MPFMSLCSPIRFATPGGAGASGTWGGGRWSRPRGTDGPAPHRYLGPTLGLRLVQGRGHDGAAHRLWQEMVMMMFWYGGGWGWWEGGPLWVWRIAVSGGLVL